MEENIILNGEKIKIKFTVGTLIKYKNQFNADCLSELENSKNQPEKRLEVWVKLMWAMCRTFDKDFMCAGDFFEYIKSCSDDEILSAVEKIIDVFDAINGQENIQNSDSEDVTDTGISTDNLATMGLMCGININDFDSLSLPCFIGIIKEYISIRYGENDGCRQATQSDFDNF